MPDKKQHTYHTPKMKRCLDDLKEQGADEAKAHAVCYSSIQGAGHKANKSLRQVVLEEVDKACARNKMKKIWHARGR